MGSGIMARASRVSQQHLVVAGAGGQPDHRQLGKGGFEVARSLPISSTSTASALMRAGASRSRRRMKSMPSRRRPGPARARRGTRRQAPCWRVDVGRVAQDQVVAAGQAARPSPCSSVMRSLPGRAVDVDAGHGQRVGARCRRVHLHVGPGHGRQHGQAAVAGAQVQHAAGVFAQPGVDAAVGQQLGDEAARHDGALVHVEGTPCSQASP
jgi:hypothetical protein